VSGPDLRPDWRTRLRWAVDRSGKTQRAIAAEAGVSPGMLSRILNAPRANPHFDAVVRIAAAVGTRVGWLVGEPDGMAFSPEDEKMLRSVLVILDKIIDATKAGRSLTILPPRR
jgi:transcriptional regulator with XRE-family HTH domain